MLLGLNFVYGLGIGSQTFLAASDRNAIVALRDTR